MSHAPGDQMAAGQAATIEHQYWVGGAFIIILGVFQSGLLN
jgi:hypothetical protein